MKRFITYITICLVLLLCASVYATPVSRSDVATTATAIEVDTNALQLLAADQLAALGAYGDVYYVDSGAGGSATGLDWTNAELTIDAGIGDCTADQGDVIFVAAGHAETFAAANAADADIAGIKIFGLGVGESRPALTYTTNGEFVIGADDVEIHGINFIAGNGVVHAIDVEAGSENWVIDNCRFWTTTVNTDEFIDCIDAAAAADNGRISNCHVEMGAASAVSFFTNVGCDYVEVSNNFIAGDFSTANIVDVTTASIWMIIKDNILINGTVGGTAGLNTVAAISLKADTSALIMDNRIFCNVENAHLAVVAADGLLSGNTYIEAEGTGSAGFGGMGRKNICVAQTGTMDSTNYGAGLQPIFTVTGSIICRATGICTANMSSDSSETLTLGVVGDAACLLASDVVDGIAFRTNDVWTLTQQCDTPSAETAGEWVIVANSLDIGLTVDDADMAAGTMCFYLEWYALSPGATVVDAAL